MNYIRPPFFFDAGISIGSAYLGFGWGIVAFIIVIYLEARIMRKRLLDLNTPTSIKFSFFLNLISTICGFPLVFIGGLSFSPHTLGETINAMIAFFSLIILSPAYALTFFQWVLLAFGITLATEFFSALLIIRPKQTIANILGFTVLSNLASYAVLFLCPLVFSFVFAFLAFLL